MRVISEIFASAWAIRPEALAAILAIAEREDIAHEAIAAAMHYTPEAQERAIERFRDVNAVGRQNATRVDRTEGLLRRGSTAILPIKGPIVRYGNLFTEMSGSGATVETMSKDFARAVDDESFTSILLDVDSPGGEASGIAELAQMIFEARGSKPIVAYVSDLGASAAYWLASAADEIVVARTAAVGSIGVVMAVRDPAATKRTSIEFVSSISPNKRPDPTTESGRSELQTFVDTLGDLFVEAVANHRNVSLDTVLSDFGAGGVRVGQDAVKVGMADRLGSFEGTLRELSERTRPQPIEQPRRKPAADTAPDSAPAAARSQERAPQPVAAPVASPDTAPDSGDLGAPMNLLDSLRTLIASADGSADQTAAIMVENAGDPPASTLPTPPPPPAAASLPAPTPASQPAVTGESDEVRRLRSENARIQAENMRLRVKQINDAARTFASTQQRDLRAMQPEVESIIALYSLLACDDEAHGPLTLTDGRTVTRLTYLETMFASRPSRRDLTDDMLGSVVTQVITDRSRASKDRDPDAEPDVARVAELMNMTSAGQDVLSALRSAQKN